MMQRAERVLSQVRKAKAKRKPRQKIDSIVVFGSFLFSLHSDFAISFLHFFSTLPMPLFPTKSKTCSRRTDTTSDDSLDLAEDPVVTPCGHLTCWPCCHEWLVTSNKRTCPTCKAPVTVDKLIPIYSSSGEEQKDPRRVFSVFSSFCLGLIQSDVRYCTETYLCLHDLDLRQHPPSVLQLPSSDSPSVFQLQQPLLLPSRFKLAESFPSQASVCRIHIHRRMLEEQGTSEQVSTLCDEVWYREENMNG